MKIGIFLKKIKHVNNKVEFIKRYLKRKRKMDKKIRRFS